MFSDVDYFIQASDIRLILIQIIYKNMKITGRTKLLFIFGNPVSHSISPVMQNNALKKLNKDICYLPLQVPSNSLETGINMLKMPNVLGANITIPHKSAVIPFLDKLSEKASIIGAVNTIKNDNGILYGTTTDPDGVFGVLEENNFKLENSNVCILGNGGTARTIAFAMGMNKKIKKLFICARSPEKIKPISVELKDKINITTEVCGTNDPEFKDIIKKTDLLINCTSAGMVPNINTIPLLPEVLHSRLTVLDMVYNPLETRLLKETKQAGGKIISGDGVLIHQGISSLKLWLDTEIPIEYFSRDVVTKNI